MNETELLKRIKDTKTDIFPLDKFLPLNTVYTLFHSEYEKEKAKSKFLNNRIYSRLREGYYALFATLAYSLHVEKEHQRVFRADPGNAGYMVELNQKTESKAYCFDVKEYTSYTDSFEIFLNKTIFPIIDKNTYDLVIGIHVSVSPEEQKLLHDHLVKKKSKRMVDLIGAHAENNDDEDISRVIALTENGVLQNQVISLKEYLHRQDSVLVFQDLVKFKSARDASKLNS